MKILIEGLIKIINNALTALRSVGVELHDDTDFDYVIDEIEWTVANKRWIVRFRPRVQEEENI
jgi:hypothetical protein